MCHNIVTTKGQPLCVPSSLSHVLRAMHAVRTAAATEYETIVGCHHPKCNAHHIHVELLCPVTRQRCHKPRPWDTFLGKDRATVTPRPRCGGDLRRYLCMYTIGCHALLIDLLGVICRGIAFSHHQWFTMYNTDTGPPLLAPCGVPKHWPTKKSMFLH